ncbi:CLUMA_CG018718, isoform A [Clunio marinus]|uniref:CLUMA_CG018718, isoform A n=1 Tax=Clunio marinus TaxID=568069 RepID=A0A1J1J2L6_9DIPT|nr:CLUMA_CG018718, isoform A [Clunio marinus]
MVKWMSETSDNQLKWFLAKLFSLFLNSLLVLKGNADRGSNQMIDFCCCAGTIYGMRNVLSSCKEKAQYGSVNISSVGKPFKSFTQNPNKGKDKI